MLSCKMPYISIDGRNCAIVKKKAPFPHLIEKKGDSSQNTIS